MQKLTDDVEVIDMETYDAIEDDSEWLRIIEENNRLIDARRASRDTSVKAVELIHEIATRTNLCHTNGGKPVRLVMSISKTFTKNLCFNVANTMPHEESKR